MDRRQFLKAVAALLGSIPVVGSCLTTQNAAARSSRRGISTGFPSIDAITGGLRGSELVVIAGRPAMGSTALALDITRHVVLAGIPTVLFSLDKSTGIVGTRMLCALSGVDAQRIRTGFLRERDWLLLAKAAGALCDRPLFIDDIGDADATYIRSALLRAPRPELIVIDGMRAMRDFERLPGTTVERETQSLKELALLRGTPIVATATLGTQVEKRLDRRPLPSDVPWAIRRHADVVMTVNRPAYYCGDTAWRGVAEISITTKRMKAAQIATLTWHKAFVTFADGCNVA